MLKRFLSAFLATLLSACATPQTYSDMTNAEERKSYVACAVTRAFLSSDNDSPPEDVTRMAIAECAGEREAVYAKLLAENAGKPFAMSFVVAYMDELHAVMLEHIALRLSQFRAKEAKATRT